MDDLKAIARLIDAVRPWHRQLVMVGGWAHQLHRLHDWATVPMHEPLRTRDADLAFPLGGALPGSILAALEAADFTEVLSGDHRPPVAEYRLRDDEGGFYVEFLAPLRGSGVRRDRTADATITRAGVTAQKLRHLELLLVEPWTVRLEPGGQVPVQARADVRVANPMTFIAQKLLIRKERKPDKQAQDVVYIHDTIELFAERREALQALWETVKLNVPPKLRRDIERLAVEQFARVDDVMRQAARMPVGRSIAPERLRATCALGLAELFGE